jgi:hypothetical protein
MLKILPTLVILLPIDLLKNNLNINKIIKYMTIKYFTILGERNSGTHFVEYAFKFNFSSLTYLKNVKHFFGYGELDTLPSLDETLIICIVRDPIEWIDSFFKRLHHVPAENKNSINNFIKNEFYSIYEEGEKNNTEIMEDRNMITGERYKNIFELRKVKNNYLMNELPKKAKHVFLLRYEQIRDSYDETMKIIQNKFNLIKNENHLSSYKQIPNYKGTYTALYSKKPILLSEEIQEYIRNHVDKEQENLLGYSC